MRNSEKRNKQNVNERFKALQYFGRLSYRIYIETRKMNLFAQASTNLCFFIDLFNTSLSQMFCLCVCLFFRLAISNMFVSIPA